MSNVDINDVEAYDQPVHVDEHSAEQAEQYFVPALPDDGDHRVTLTLQDNKGVTLGRQKNKQTKKPDGEAYAMANFAFEVESSNGGRSAFVFDNALSLVRNGSSRLHAVMAILGEPIPSGLTTNQIKDGDDYKTVKKGQRNFKQKDDGTFDPEFEHDGQVVRAQAKVIRYKKA